MKLAVIGSGFFGITLGLILSKKHEVDLFEKFWIDKVDMVTFQSFQPPNYKEDFSKFYPDQFTDKKTSDIGDFKCPQPFQRVVIRNDNITACCNTMSNRLSLGRLKDGIYNAWNGKLANELRKACLFLSRSA